MAMIDPFIVQNQIIKSKEGLEQVRIQPQILVVINRQEIVKSFLWNSCIDLPQDKKLLLAKKK